MNWCIPLEERPVPELPVVVVVNHMELSNDRRQPIYFYVCYQCVYVLAQT